MPRDIAHEWTDKKLEKLENRIAKVYREARDSLNDTIRTYFESFRKRDEEMKKLICPRDGAGHIFLLRGGGRGHVRGAAAEACGTAQYRP